MAQHRPVQDREARESIFRTGVAACLPARVLPPLQPLTGSNVNELRINLIEPFASPRAGAKAPA